MKNLKWKRKGKENARSSITATRGTYNISKKEKKRKNAKCKHTHTHTHTHINGNEMN